MFSRQPGSRPRSRRIIAGATVGGQRRRTQDRTGGRAAGRRRPGAQRPKVAFRYDFEGPPCVGKV